METKYIKSDGSPVPRGHCVLPDHWETTIVVKLRTLTPPSPDMVKGLLQTKYEVTDLKVTAQTCVVK